MRGTLAWFTKSDRHRPEVFRNPRTCAFINSRVFWTRKARCLRKERSLMFIRTSLFIIATNYQRLNNGYVVPRYITRIFDILNELIMPCNAKIQAVLSLFFRCRNVNTVRFLYHLFIVVTFSFLSNLDHALMFYTCITWHYWTFTRQFFFI
jgi:hypothetical protein